MGIMGFYGVLAFGITKYNSLKPKPPIAFESAEQESFVKKYVAFAKEESKKPLLVRESFKFDGKY
jgi:hypothetical protein